ncbi:DUF7009 family protein [Labilithrix luteola]|nr:hypothetical protein [Labilithrix luteola]
MKLRLRDDSVRLRLTRSEVQAVAERRPVRGVVRFGSGRFSYVLESTNAVERISATFASGSNEATITVRVPHALAKTWAEGDEVGMEGSVSIGPGQGELAILVEKDFACLTQRGEDESDMYPHPAAAKRPNGAC